MKKYEGMFIIKPDMNQEDLEKTVGSIEGVITRNGGRVEASRKWAKRQLAYPVKKYREGEYYLFDFESEPKAIAELERAYRLNDNILRMLITVKEGQ